MNVQTLTTLILVLAGCNLRPYDDVTGTTGTGATAATTMGATAATTGTTAATSTGTGTTAEGTSTTTSSDPTTSTGPVAFLARIDGGPHSAECDLQAQNCPLGQKCMPYASDGDDMLDSARCVGIVRDPDGLYEPCTAEGGGLVGEDSCDLGLFCAKLDPDTGVGICFGMCVGDDLECVDPAATCVISGNSVLTLCIPACSPLLQDCPGAELCIPHPSEPWRFICVADASGDAGQTFDPCEFPNACDPGLFCADPGVAAECDAMAIGCCDPFCDVTLPNTCPGAGQECLPWYEPGMAPPVYENVGYCTLPMP